MSAQYPSSVFSSGYKKFDKKAKNPEEMKIRTHAAISVTVNHDWSLVREGCRKQRRERGKKSGNERDASASKNRVFWKIFTIHIFSSVVSRQLQLSPFAALQQNNCPNL